MIARLSLVLLLAACGGADPARTSVPPPPSAGGPVAGADPIATGTPPPPADPAAVDLSATSDPLVITSAFMPLGSSTPGSVTPGSAPAGEIAMPLSIRSTAFADMGSIPKKNTCQGGDVSPALEWGGIPEGTLSLVVIVDDPDAPDPAAPRMTWVHWVLYDIPPTATSLSEGIAADALPTGTRQGKNDWKKFGYGGPCPPIGQHRYFHKLYALDVVLGDLAEPTKAAIEKAMQGHILGQTQIVGTYQKG